MDGELVWHGAALPMPGVKPRDVNRSALAEAASLPTSSHAFVEASAHLLAVSPTAHWLEVLDKARPILQWPALIKDGMVMPRGPGLGMEWDEAVVERYAV